MNEIEISNIFEKRKVFLFLLNTKYRKFNLWPNATEKKITEFLSEEIESIQNNGVLFIASFENEIIAFLTIKYLDWDTQFYKFKCAKIDFILTNKKFRETKIIKALNILMERVQKYAKEEKIKFISTNIDSWEIVQGIALQKNNFKFILTWVNSFIQSSNLINKTEKSKEVGLIREDEINYFKKIAKENYFKGGRFYLDHNFDKEMVGKMYANLIESSYKNNSIMLVYRLKNRPIGLFICKEITACQSFSNIRIAPLRFLIVDPNYRNRHIGENLFMGTLSYLSKKCDLITTGLEVNNIPSLNLHSRLGFKFNYSQNVFHWWNDNI